jgi:hypothetical protein
LVAAPGIPPHVVYRVRIEGLVPGEEFSYRVLKSGDPVFLATARARKSVTQSYRFVLFGDCAQGTPSARTVAYRVSQAKPDFVFITGDIVYTAGRISEYREKFFPVYNADEAAADIGAPLIRSTLFIAAPGNHDTALANFARFPDALAYFLYWDQPLNGPVPPPDATGVAHVPTGDPIARQAFLDAPALAIPEWLISPSTTAIRTGPCSIPTPIWTGPIPRVWIGLRRTWQPPDPRRGASSPSTIPLCSLPEPTSTISGCPRYPRS